MSKITERVGRNAVAPRKSTLRNSRDGRAKNRRICVINSFLDGREKECDLGLYPRHQLWEATRCKDMGIQWKPFLL